MIYRRQASKDEFLQAVNALPESFKFNREMVTPQGTIWRCNLEWDWSHKQWDEELDSYEWRDNYDRFQAAERREILYVDMLRANIVKTKLQRLAVEGRIRRWSRIVRGIRKMRRIEDKWVPGAPVYSKVLDEYREAGRIR